MHIGELLPVQLQTVLKIVLQNVCQSKCIECWIIIRRIFGWENEGILDTEFLQTTLQIIANYHKRA